MMKDKSTHILARLEIGFRTDAARLKALEKELTVTLQSARQFGQQHGSPDNWNTHWHQQWDEVEGILRRIRALVSEMQYSLASGESERLKEALEAWEMFEAEDAKLVEALCAIRAEAGGLNAAVRRDWNILARTLEPHLETIHACAQALRIRLELLKQHSKAAVDQLVLDILSKLPNRTHTEGVEVENLELEYRQAAAELEQEHHRFLGFMDVVKGLLLWIETTEERVSKNRSLTVAEA